MANSLSVDLRSRVVSAVDAGISRREAAERFGVSAASAVRWVAQWQDTGSVQAKAQSGDPRSGRIEVLGPVILAAIDKKADITLVELVETLVREHGERFAPSSVGRFLDRHAMTVK